MVEKVERFDITPNGVKVAVIQYATGVRTEFDLNTHNSKNAIIQGIKNVQS